MTKGLFPPELERFAETTNKRLSDLERRLRNAFDKDGDEQVWSAGGEADELSTDLVFPAYTWARAVRLSAVVLIVTPIATAGTTTMTVNVNGVAHTTVSVDAGSRLRKLTISKQIAPDQDVVDVTLDAVGTGVDAVSLILRHPPPA